MTIGEMHTTFRALGQRVGMQNFRAITDDVIDIFLNQSIINKVRSIINTSIEVDLKDGKFLHDSNINITNSLYNLMCVESTEEVTYIGNYPYSLNELKYLNIIDIDVYIKKSTDDYDANKARFITISDINTIKKDYCNAPTEDSPIYTLMNEGDDKYITIYFGDNNSRTLYLNIWYIKYPNIVHLDTDSNNNVDCDLAEFLHYDIVEDAVQRYFNSINLSLQNKQSNKQ